jgi:hypothetical protein
MDSPTLNSRNSNRMSCTVSHFPKYCYLFPRDGAEKRSHHRFLRALITGSSHTSQSGMRNPLNNLSEVFGDEVNCLVVDWKLTWRILKCV